MPQLLPKSGQSLQVWLTVLISVLVLATAAALGFFYYRAMQSQLTLAQHNLFRATSTLITSNIEQSGAGAAATTNLLAHSALAETYSMEERVLYTGQLVAVLRGNPALQAVYMAYPNGDFFLLRRLDDAARQALPDAGPGARWARQLVQQQPDGVAEQRFSFLDDALNSVQPELVLRRVYDPRQRPWYQQAVASHGAAATEPYRFSTTGLIGLTYAHQNGDASAVAGADLRLLTLGTILRQNLPSAAAQMAIVNTAHDILVSTHTDERDPRPVKLGESAPSALATLGTQWHPGTAPPAVIEWQGQQWHVAVSALPGGSHQQLVMVMPEHELFAAGRAVAERAAWIPLLILLLMLPLGWLLSRLLSQPLRQLVAASGRIQSLDFSDSSLPPSPVRELNELMAASEAMKVTIRDFIGLSRDMVAENALEQLLGTVLQSTMHALPAQRGGLWLMDGAQLAPSISRDEHEQPLQLGNLPLDDALLLDTLAASAPQQIAANPALIPVEMRSLLGEDTRQLILLPLRLESQELLGLLVLASSESIAHTQSGHRINYLQALVGFAAIAIDNRRLASALQQLMNALVELIAGAIDAKSPYTGGHCQRVPELAQALAEAAHQSQQGPFAGFQLSAADREALYIASWLHDCGKVTTPEYVVDKATKLETLYDRIHEIRMRFELLKRDADVAYWQGLAAGEDAARLKEQCQQQKAQLDDDFAFVARCNLGGEFMDDADLARLQQIAGRRWTRTLDDRLGLGPMERARLAGIAAPSLPVEENLLADKPEHRIARSGADTLPTDNRWGFKVKVPELLYNKGELSNLSIRRGTLTEEERYKINAHITETIKMLHALPFPAHLAHVPEIAGGHHERIDGKGYPRGLHGHEMSVLARVMAIADVFEALTAADRPYKPAKPLSEALQIMRKMAEDGHLDPELYQLFLDSGIWRHYAGRYLAAAQADVADSYAYRPRQSLHQH
ncbi:HD domain-containing phosphohydrolase [Vogesella indigofera]|uniref:HD-GYP domain-containing protein (C-di-GMP phosphodiesterase class II) n=1 Tax=Vogesella indigofera TaxID=45465 RepID=A0ABT5I079_VOGIN|nr:HD domain-containing phosphohydrolase [Vogesella indigofera]MDC7689574.1 hypothetical protein [Vogesella indigofera]